jgi:hypothetical protein
MWYARMMNMMNLNDEKLTELLDSIIKLTEAVADLLYYAYDKKDEQAMGIAIEANYAVGHMNSYVPILVMAVAYNDENKISEILGRIDTKKQEILGLSRLGLLANVSNQAH